jgi:hypothetical protein
METLDKKALKTLFQCGFVDNARYAAFFLDIQDMVLYNESSTICRQRRPASALLKKIGPLVQPTCICASMNSKVKSWADVVYEQITC